MILWGENNSSYVKGKQSPILKHNKLKKLKQVTRKLTLMHLKGKKRLEVFL